MHYLQVWSLVSVKSLLLRVLVPCWLVLVPPLLVISCRVPSSSEVSSLGVRPCAQSSFWCFCLGYEFWKKTFIDVLGPESASRNRTAVYIASSAIAEFFADVALCPLEATRIRLVSQPTFASGMSASTCNLALFALLSHTHTHFTPLRFWNFNNANSAAH